MAATPSDGDRRSGKPVVILDPDDGTPLIILPGTPAPDETPPSSPSTPAAAPARRRARR